MKKPIFFMLIILLSCMALTALANDNPISASIEVMPSTLTGPSPVNVSINVVNLGEEEAIDVTLLDPAGSICTGFGMSGTASLAPGQSQSYTTTWIVTQRQLEAGKAIYSLRYSIQDKDVGEVPVTKPVAAMLENNSPQVSDYLQIEQMTQGHQTVSAGETLVLLYRLTNVSNELIEYVQIEDSEMLPTPAMHAPLYPGDSTVISYRFLMDMSERRSNPLLVYQLEGETMPYSALLEPSFFYAEQGLVAALQMKQVVNPGDRVELQYTIVNATNNAFSNIRVIDAVLGEIDTNLTLGPGKTYQGFASVVVNESMAFQLTILAVDEAGNEIDIKSNTATVQTTDSIKDTVNTTNPQDAPGNAQTPLDIMSLTQGHWSTWRYEQWAAYRDEVGDLAPMYALPSTDEMMEAEAIQHAEGIILAEYPQANLADTVLTTAFIRQQGDRPAYWDIAYRETAVDKSGAHPYLFNVHLSVTDGAYELAVRIPGWDEIVMDTMLTSTLYYNNLGGKYFHADNECTTISSEYLPLEAFEKQQLAQTPYHKLKPCFSCVLTRAPQPALHKP